MKRLHAIDDSNLVKRRQLLTGLGSGLALTWLGGCQPKQDEKKTQPSVASEDEVAPLKVLVREDEALGAGLASLWKAQHEAELVLVKMTGEELAKARRIAADIVIFPPSLMGQMVTNGLIDPLASELLESQPLNYRDFWQSTRTHVCQFGGKTYGIPLGAPNWTLVYRQDLLDAAQLKVPTTWVELAEVVKGLKEWASKEEGRSAITLPLAKGWGGEALLAWGAAYLADPEQVSPLFDPVSMEPQIDLPPFVRALEELVSMQRETAGASGSMKLHSPQDAFAAMASGKSAMALTWPIMNLPSDSKADGVKHLRYAMVPGSTERFDYSKRAFVPKEEGTQPFVPLLGSEGRVMAISSSASQLRVAERFLGWATGESNLVSLASKSSGISLVRESMKGTAARWLPVGSSSEAVATFGEAQAEISASEQVLVALRIPGAQEYMAALDQAVEKALAETPAKDALAEAKQTFQAITERLGVANQMRALKRSLGQSVA